MTSNVKFNFLYFLILRIPRYPFPIPNYTLAIVTTSCPTRLYTTQYFLDQNTTTMALTLDDFLKVTKASDEARAKERADDLALRSQERSDDLKKIAEMIKVSVRTEVDEAIGPVIIRQESFEVKSNKMYCDLAQEIASIKKHISSQENAVVRSTSYRDAAEKVSSDNFEYHDDFAIKTNIELAECIVGFEPIFDDRDIDRMGRRHETTNRELAMKHALIEFLQLEMKNR